MSKNSLAFACSQCGRQIGVGPELAGRRVRCPLCREIVTAPTTSPDEVSHRPAKDQGKEGAESIFADPEEADDSVFGGGPAYRKPVLPSDPALNPVTTSRPAPRMATPIISKPPSSQHHPTAQPATTEATPIQVAEGSPFADLGELAPPDNASSKRPKRVTSSEKQPIPVWVWVIVALAGYGIVMTVLAAWGWMR